MKKTIVTFKIGRGGQFYNGGHRTFFEDCGIGDIYIVKEYLYPPKLNPNDTADDTVDESPEAEYTDCDGNSVELTNAMIESGIGRINIDHDYESYYSTYLEDCDENELLILLNDDRKYLIEYFIDHFTDLDVEWDRLKSSKDTWKDLISCIFYGSSNDVSHLYEEDEDED